MVVIGGGFGGLQAVRKLRGAPVEITLIDRRNFHLFQPLVYQVATGSLSAEEIASPLRSVFRRNKNVHVVLGEVTGFDLAARHVKLDHLPSGGGPREIPYDSLIVAAGSKYTYFGHDEWRPFAPDVKSVESALEVRRRILTAFEAADTETDPDRRAAWLTFVIVGAGPTGVELAGQIGEIARHAVRNDFRDVDTGNARILLVETADRVLPPFPPRLSQRAGRALEGLGVTVLTSHTVVEIDATSLTLRDEDGATERVAARTVIWAAGVIASELATSLDAETGSGLDRAGRISVGPDLTLPGHPEVIALGEMALLHDADGKAVPLPGVAPVAMQQGRYAARGDPRSPDGRHDEALPLPRQGQPGDDRPREGRRRHQGAAAERGARVVHLALRAPLLPDRPAEPGDRLHPLELELRHARPGRAPDHRAGDHASRARSPGSRRARRAHGCDTRLFRVYTTLKTLKKSKLRCRPWRTRSSRASG